MAALSEIGDTSGRDVMEIDTSVLQKLLAALNECTEWGQVGWPVSFSLEPWGLGGGDCLLYTSPSPRDGLLSRMPSSA